MHKGGCLCGAVRYEIDGPLRPVVACHCSQCRKTSGHFAAMTAADREDVRVVSQETLVWYESSDSARRGFCSRCGSNVFWSKHAAAYLSITAGTLDGPTGLSLTRQIFTGDAGDYYSVDGVCRAE